MDALNPRRARIAEVARAQGFVTIEGLADGLAVTPQTIRRDINWLCDSGVLVRFHGGAAYRSSVANLPYAARQETQAEAKAELAALVAAEIPDRSSVFLDIGTTAEAVATALRIRSGLRVVTNNLNIVSLMAGAPDVEVTIACGIVRPRDRAVAGPLATAFVERFRLDYSVLGVVAIDADGAILDFDADEEPLTQAILRCGRQAFIVADRSKFGRQAMARVAHVSQATALFTEAPPPELFGRAIADCGVRLVCARRQG